MSNQWLNEEAMPQSLHLWSGTVKSAQENVR